MPKDEPNRGRREAAAAKYKPGAVKLLLIAEAPPCTTDRYFYFEDVQQHDSLFRYVCRGIFGVIPPRDRKADYLAELRDSGVFLIDLSEEPIPDGAKTRIAPQQVDKLIARCRDLNPQSIILIKSNVYDLSYKPLKSAKFNVIDARMPFPASGQQNKFALAFATALKQAGFK
jgi:hypothetical protein